MSADESSVKPSDRIRELFEKQADSVLATLPHLSHSEQTTVANLMAIVAYLDECHEAEQKALAEFREWKKERGF